MKMKGERRALIQNSANPGDAKNPIDPQKKTNMVPKKYKSESLLIPARWITCNIMAVLSNVYRCDMWCRKKLLRKVIASNTAAAMGIQIFERECAMVVGSKISLR
jgi:hypothetical protein